MQRTFGLNGALGEMSVQNLLGKKWGFVGENGRPKGHWVEIDVLWENGCAKGLLG